MVANLKRDSFRRIERKLTDEKILHLKHDWSNMKYCLNVYCVNAYCIACNVFCLNFVMYCELNTKSFRAGNVVNKCSGLHRIPC